MKNRAHILLQNDNLNMQEDFAFFDTETKTIGEDEEVLRLGWVICWNRPANKTVKTEFTTPQAFWDVIEAHNRGEIILYAHNTDFDFKIVDGYNEMIIRRGYSVRSLYIRGSVFILIIEKGGFRISIYDTFNYVQQSLEFIGEAIGLPKKEIDFKTATYDKLSAYCLNDTEIIHKLIKSLIEFLTTNELSRIKATAGSLSLNAFRHRFYDKETTPIYIHDHRQCITMERKAYKGGISDCYKVGRYKKTLTKLDINSMYPYIMKKHPSPTRLIYYSEDKEKEDLKKLLTEQIKHRHIIAEVTIRLPKKYAYILTSFTINNEDKKGFLSGEFTETLSTPELEYAIKYGEIITVHKIGIYEKTRIFTEYVDFFYKKRLEYDRQNNGAFSLFCKGMLNNLYGKFGQRGGDLEILSENAESDIAKYTIVDENGQQNIIHMGTKVMRYTKNDDNAYDSFVAIAAMITAYARMYLIEMIIACGREHIYYCDTDSLIVDREGLKNLKRYVDYKGKQLGKLKVEETSDNSVFYRPKFYIFGKEFKCKGVSKKHTVINENSDVITIEQPRFERFKTSMKTKHLSSVRVTKIRKTMTKRYDKGIINEDNTIEPYTIEYLNEHERPRRIRGMKTTYDKVYSEPDLKDPTLSAREINAEITRITDEMRQ